MRHAAIVFSILMTLMSGFVLSQLWALEPASSRPIQAMTSSQVEETALDFYQAVNAYLDGGDDASLRQILHPGFATHQSGSSWAGTAEELLHHLDSVRLLYPGIQLEPDAISLGNNTASVTLSVSSQQRLEFAGIGIDPVDVVGRLDFLRIERGLIAELWSSAPLAGQLESFPALSVDLPASIDTMVARVQQVPLESASEPAINHVRHLLLIVESGEALLDVTSQSTIPAMIWRVNHGHVAAATPVETEMALALNPMEAMYLPAGTRFRMWDSSNRDTTLIALEFGPPMSPEIPSSAPLVTALGRTLWSGIELEGVGDRLTLSLGSARLLPNSMLSSEATVGMALTWVTSGSIEMSAGGGEARVRKAGGTRSQLTDGHALLLAGESAAAGPGSTIRYLTSGNEPTTAWFFSIVPASVDDASVERASSAPDPTPAPPPNRTLS